MEFKRSVTRKVLAREQRDHRENRMVPLEMGGLGDFDDLGEGDNLSQ